jgi:predicted TIM-barrel fold metal-dependent hydrolase
MIDADVHCAPASIDALAPYLDDYWRDYVANAGMRLNPTLTGAYPPAAGPPAPSDVETLAAERLDPAGLTGAILNCVTSFDVSRNVYYEAALTRAINDWLKAEWLERDDRLRASLVVPTLDTDAAVEEIERLGGDERFVQVLLPVRNETPWGNKRFHPLFGAAAKHDLVIGLHA